MSTLLRHYTPHAIGVSPPLPYEALRYICGDLPPRYPLPSIIGYQQTSYGVYQFDTRTRLDGMPLFRGYTWEQWNEKAKQWCASCE